MKTQFASSALVWVLCSTVQADIINVPGDQPDIQTAINVAVNGDEVIVAQGVYLENINFNGKAITVRSTNPNDAVVVLNTLIYGGGAGSVVTCSSGEGSDTILSGFLIAGGSGTGSLRLGGGMYNLSSSPTVMNCTFIGNTANFGGGGMYNENSGPSVSNCSFSGNSAAFIGGGGMLNNKSSPTVTNCSFIGNSAGGIGGGGMFNTTSSPSVTNCSFSGNSALLGGGMYNDSGNPTMTNCILWGDSPDEIFINSGSTSVTYSNIQGGFSGLGNINSDPFFADPLGPDGTAGTLDDDLRLATGSPCIDAGINSAVPFGVTTDLDGNPRFLDDPNMPDTGAGAAPLVDMGAYEFDPSCPADASGDDVVNVTDLLMLLGAWGSCPASCPPDITGDGLVNVTDLLNLLGAWGVCL